MGGGGGGRGVDVKSWMFAGSRRGHQNGTCANKGGEGV